MNIFTHFDNQANILFYPFTLLSQTYSLIVSGAGTIKAALLALKEGLFTGMYAIFYPPLPFTFILAPNRESITIFFTQAEYDNYIAQRPLNEQELLDFEEKCLALIARNTGKLSETKRCTLIQYYQRVLLTCFDPATSDSTLKRTAALAGKFYKHMVPQGIRTILLRVLDKYPGWELQQQWKKLATVNLHLCVTLTGIMTRNVLRHWYGVNCTFLSKRLPGDEAEAFLSSLEQQPSLSYTSAVHYAVHHEKFLSMLPALLQGDPDRINMRDSYGLTLLLHAAKKEDLKLIRYLVQHQANINDYDIYGETALMSVCESGNKKIAKILLKHDADTDAQNRWGDTALMAACIKGNIGIVRLLLRHGADTEIRGRFGRTALLFACWQGKIDIVRLLLANGANVNVYEDALRDAPLTYARGEKEADIVQLLLESGAKIDWQNVLGETALMRACEHGNTLVAQLLLRHGADIEKKDQNGHTALMKACEHGNRAIVELLLQHSADMEAKNNKGENALSIAEKRGHHDIVRLLESYQQLHTGLPENG